MSNSVRWTSIETYKNLLENGAISNQEYQVLDSVLTIQKLGWDDATRREIATQAGMETSSVAGRVNGLLKKHFLEESDPRLCRLTKRTVIPVRLAEKKPQLKLI